MIDLLGVPFDLCGRSSGSRLGPATLRLAGIEEALNALGCKVEDTGDVMVLPEDSSEGGLRNFGPLLSSLTEVQQRVEETLNKSRLPLVMGGDHTIALGGISAALAKFDGSLAVLWIDAHADLNTPGSSGSGNPHGMPLAALLQLDSGTDGLRNQQWQELVRRLGPKKLEQNRISWLGLRDVDKAERNQIAAMPDCFAASMHDIDRHGIVRLMERFDQWMHNSTARKLWISFDVDALDPVLAPGTGTAVRGGLTYREGHLVAETLYEFLHRPDCPYSLAGVDLVETNPAHDINNETAKVAVEWVASLFGKTILEGRRG